MASAVNLATDPDTIYALSSGRPPAAIAIVRISGPGARAALIALTGKPDPTPRLATLSTLRAADGDEIDRGLTLWFPAPVSATGEDVAELHLHGGVATVEAALAALAAFGLRLAEPGEFTRRSFLNGKIDANDVVALADLLTAQTDYQRREALGRSRRHRSAAIADWSRRLTELAATIEAAIEQDDDDETLQSTIVEGCATIASEIAVALARQPVNQIRDGAQIVIAGPANAGKSSLFNVLCERDRAIVTSIAGTTRDVLEQAVDFEGYPVVFVDTAGLRSSTDHVEQIGIERARERVERADIVVDLGDAAEDHPRRIAVQSKSDLTERPANGRIAVSVVTGGGLTELRHRIGSLLPNIFPVQDRCLGTADKAALRELAAALTTPDPSAPIVVIAEKIRLARHELERAGEHAGVEPVLDAVYSRFCLGK